MPRPVEEMSAAQIEAELKNHKAWRQDGKPYSQQNAARYQELLAARNTREGWHFETSRGAIEAAARRGEFLSYADLAKAFLFDKDGPGPKEKLAAYYHGIVKAKE